MLLVKIEGEETYTLKFKSIVKLYKLCPFTNFGKLGKCNPVAIVEMKLKWIH